MKKLTLFFFALLAVCLAFQACDNSKTYAEMLEEEKDAQSEFYAQDSTTDVSRNEYVQLASGVYMQIVDKGSTNPADTIKPNDLVLVRYEELNLQSGYLMSNLDIPIPDYLDEFKYTVTSSSIAGIFIKGSMRLAYGTSVPAGWLVALKYVRDRAHVKLIVPSKMGQQQAMDWRWCWRGIESARHCEVHFSLCYPDS